MRKVHVLLLSFALALSAGAGSALAASQQITGVTNFQEVARLTGTPSLNNTTTPYDVGGADLGIPIYHNGKTYFLFGDTFSGEDSYVDGNWRRNTMAWSTDTTPANGIVFEDWLKNTTSGKAKVTFTNNQPSGSGVITNIPTGGISANGNLYVYFMNVNSWSPWTVSQAELAKWGGGNNTFSLVSGCTFAANGNFDMVAVREGQPGDPYLYLWGTPPGRAGGVKLARVLPAQIETRGAYQFYDGLVGGAPQWISDEFQADLIVPSGVGEMSVMYNNAVGAWTMLYLNGINDRIEIRQAPNPWGPWSTPVTVLQTYAELEYAPMMYPSWVEDGGRTIYFTMSEWVPYDVYLAKVTLTLVPEPSTAALLAAGFGAVSWFRRARKRAR